MKIIDYLYKKYILLDFSNNNGVGKVDETTAWMLFTPFLTSSRLKMIVYYPFRKKRKFGII